MRLRSRPALISFLLVSSTVVACAPELEKFEPRVKQRATFGEEVYKVVCRRVAGTEMPTDAAGTRSEAVCLGDAATVQSALTVEGATLPPRLVALAQRRERIAQAINDMLPDPLSDEFEVLLRSLVPFYDPPEEQVQEATREIAQLLLRLVDPNNPGVLDGFARLGRVGMLSREGNIGILRGTMGASHTRGLALSVLAAAMDDPLVKPHYETVLKGLALELSTSTIDADAQTDARRLKQLVQRPSPDFGSGKPLYGVERDARGLPKPTRSSSEEIPYPLRDANADGLADATDVVAQGDGAQLQTRPEFTGRLPEPFPTIGEGPVARDAFGRAYAIAPDGSSDMSRPLYQTTDIDSTLLAGLLRAAKKVIGDEQLAQDMSLVLGTIVGEHAPTTQRYGVYDFGYAAPDASKSPLLDLVHGSSALFDRSVADASIVLTKRTFEQYEAELVASLEPLLTLERRTRPGSDAYPTAALKADNTFWDELLFEAEKVSRRRNDATGETLLEAMLRGTLGFGRNLSKPGAPIEQIVDPELLRHQGVVLATLMRFKDEWRANPKGESKRAANEPIVLGSFRTPVDRSKGDTPVTCGSDGCGGLIAGTPFEAWKTTPTQQCMLQRDRRNANSKDCGAPANQSLLQRSLGLIAEMGGRSQCNKSITIRSLLDFTLVDSVCTGKDGTPAPNTPACDLLKTQEEANRRQSVIDSEIAVARDYACPKGPDGSFTGACAAYADRYPAAFVDPDGPNNGVPSAIRECHMINLPDVGRTFGAAVTHEFKLAFPNPWVHRYLEDIARADGSLPACNTTAVPAFVNYPIVDPTIAPNCTPEAARLSRDVYASNEADRERLLKVHALADLVEFLLDDTTLFGTNPQDRADLRPNVKSLSRVLFAPAGSTNFNIFDPLLVRGAPPLCSAKPGAMACSDDDTQRQNDATCCIADVNKPPFRFRLDTYYGSTSFAWEHAIKLSNGKSISFLDTMGSVSDAVARFDYDAARGDDPSKFEDLGYVFSSIGKVIAEHYDSPDNTAAQASDPNALNYRRLTGIVRYEQMLADLFDDASADRAQLASDGKPLFAPEQTYSKEQQLGVLYHSFPLMQALDVLDLGEGRDGIDVSAEVSEQLLSAHARCAGDTQDRRVIGGQGACDRALRGEPGFEKPFTHRSSTPASARNYVCWSDKRCFDGMAGRPHRFTSPLYGMLDAIGAMDDAASTDQARDKAQRNVVSRLLDAYLTTANGKFSDRNMRALIVGMLDDTRDRLTEERKAGTLSTFAQRTDEDMAELLHNPVVAGALGLFEGLRASDMSKPTPGTAIRDLSLFAGSSLSEEPQQNNLRPVLAGMYDLVQLLPGDAATNATLRAFGAAFAKDVDEVVKGTPGVALSTHDSAFDRNVFMLRKTAEFDTSNVTERLMQNLARIPEGRNSPLEVILEAVLAINRKVPGETSTPTAEDLGLTLRRIADVMLDERRGFERLYDLMRCSKKGAEDPMCK